MFSRHAGSEQLVHPDYSRRPPFTHCVVNTPRTDLISSKAHKNFYTYNSSETPPNPAILLIHKRHLLYPAPPKLNATLPHHNVFSPRFNLEMLSGRPVHCSGFLAVAVRISGRDVSINIVSFNKVRFHPLRILVTRTLDEEYCRGPGKDFTFQ